ncbi:MAG TPA: hypothetical protein VIB39_03435 [Candidatus Angelobacter sp.]|jgi:nucleotide-binding universal stress UspA family protein
MKKKILSISYDEALLTMRELLLEREGYEVISAYGFVAAMEICIACDGFDLILIGAHHTGKRQNSTHGVLASQMPCTTALDRSNG